MNKQSNWPSLARIDGGGQARAVVLLAHGAGAGMDHPFMAQMAAELACEQIAVVRFEFDYMVIAREQQKRRPPQRIDKLTECYQRWISAAKQNYPELPVYVAGKSMGGRVACVCGATEEVAGVFALGYPFHPVGKTEPEKWRWQPLEQSSVPVWIIQGERDAFGSKTELSAHSFPKHCNIQWLEDGDHSFEPRKRSGLTQAQHIHQAAQWLRQKIKD